MVDICVVALIGLPGAGKTTFCKNLAQHNPEFNFIHICFDEIFTFHPESSGETFKNERLKVMRKIQQIIDELKSNSQGNMMGSLNVILVDDNNYYAGMRYELYKICKTNEICFGQVYIPIDLECALKRNVGRGSNALPPNVLERMNERLERPSDKNRWETNTLVIANIEEREEFYSFLKFSFCNPLKPMSKENKVESMKVSLIHEVDLCLRKRIKEILGNSEGNLSEKANMLNSRRKQILTDIRKKDEFDRTLDVQSLCESLMD